MITNGLVLAYIWEIVTILNVDSPPLKADFVISYSSKTQDCSKLETHSYHYYFTIKDYEVCFCNIFFEFRYFVAVLDVVYSG